MHRKRQDDQEISLGPKNAVILELTARASTRHVQREGLSLDLKTLKGKNLNIISPTSAAGLTLNGAKRTSWKSQIENHISLTKRRQNHLGLNADVRDKIHVQKQNISNWDQPVRANSSTHDLSKVVYDPEDLELLLEAGRNVMNGLQSEFLYWDKPNMVFILQSSLSSLPKFSFSDLLLQLSHCGSWIRRLNKAVEDIRSAVESIQAPLSLLAVASAIEREIFNQQQLLIAKASQATRLTELVTFTEEPRNEVQMLAVLIGCDDLTRRGRLSRIPSAIEILQRSYTRASLLKSALLWRVTSAVMKPWIDQLNFAVGLKDISIRRVNDEEMKSRLFPELFLDVDEKTGNIILVKELIPSFFPLTIATAVHQCYHLLCIAGVEESGMDFLASQIVPSPLGISSIPESHLSLKPLPRLSLSSERHHDEIGSHISTAENLVSSPEDSMQLLLMSTFSSILKRRIELDVSVKTHFFLELEMCVQVITGLYLLTNGRFWSLLIDLIPQLQSKRRLSAFGDIQELVQREFNHSSQRILVLVSPSSYLGFTIDYKVPEVFTRMFPSSDELWLAIRERFETMLNLHYTNPKEFVSYSDQTSTMAENIKCALYSERAGISELISAISALAN